MPTVIETYGETYPELVERQSVISGLIEREEEAFGTTIKAGTKRFNDIVASLKSRGETQIAGEEVFRLYETYGFPRELTQDIAAQAGLSVDAEGYQRAADAHSQISIVTPIDYDQALFGNLPTEFVGYFETRCRCRNRGFAR